MADTLLLDEFGPLPIVRPAIAAELGMLTGQAAAEGHALYATGGRTTLSLGGPPTRLGFVVDLRGLDQVIDYPARDMTITVQAGLTVAKLQALLATENQRLPIDVPQPELATLGGILATNVCGPRRLGYGTLRDYLIGISFINDRGEEVKGGGRVVKNVAGYDMPKLHIGALGTLGIITQVTLKLKPRPEEQALLALDCSVQDLAPTLDLLHQSRTRPVCVELLNPAAATYIEGAATSAWRLIVGYEDNRETVNWQVQQLIRELGPSRELKASIGCTAEPLWQRLAAFPAWPEGVFCFKASMLPSATAAFCREACQRRPAWLLQAHAGNGIVVGQADASLKLEDAAVELEALRKTAAASQGSVIVQRCPPAWKQRLSVWGPARPEVALMRAVKAQLDRAAYSTRGDLWTGFDFIRVQLAILQQGLRHNSLT